MPTVFVTGANRGLGYEHVKQYAAKGWKVIACARNPEQAKELKELKDTFGEDFIIEQLEVVDHNRIEELAEKYRDTAIDILINNAGTTGPMGVPGAMGYQKIDSMDYQIWRDILEVNVLSPFKIATAFRNHIAASEKIIALSRIEQAVRPSDGDSDVVEGDRLEEELVNETENVSSDEAEVKTDKQD
mgnify:CR=1 FL=1